MTDTIRTAETRDARYYVKSGKEKDIIVTVHIEVDGKKELVKTELVDISAGGARLRTREPVNAKHIVELELKVKRSRRSISVAGEVCWMVPASGDNWWVGCSFSPRIPDETLKDFAEGGILERRKHRREDVTLLTTVKWELESDTATVRIVNFSQGGFSLLCQDPGKPGDRVLLHFGLPNGREALVRGKAQWQVETDEGFLIGCEFLDPGDYAIFRQLKSEDRNSSATSLSVWKFFAGSSG